MGNFLYDLLRDRGSSKISTTKVFAFVFTIFLLIYCIFALFVAPFIFEEYGAIDHVIVVQFLGIVGTLLGLKNKWGIGGAHSTQPKTGYQAPKVATPPPSDSMNEESIDDESVF